MIFNSKSIIYADSLSFQFQKWTKGKAKDKVNNAVFIERKGLDSVLNSGPKIGKVVTVSTFVEKNKVNG